jgi:hypothetical protein
MHQEARAGREGGWSGGSIYHSSNGRVIGEVRAHVGVVHDAREAER